MVYAHPMRVSALISKYIRMMVCNWNERSSSYIFGAYTLEGTFSVIVNLIIIFRVDMVMEIHCVTVCINGRDIVQEIDVVTGN